MNSRRSFLKHVGLATAGAALSTPAFSAASYRRIPGANDRVRVGVAGFSDRFRQSLLPAFLNHHKELNFDVVGVSDIWKLRREAGQAHLKDKLGHDIKAYLNNDQMYDSKTIDAVIISTADFQHALHTVDAVKAGMDTYLSLIHI